MLQLLNPIWLFGIGGILIPLIIHLWNVKTGKTLKVGSIALMGESSRQNSRSLKLMDLLLLFLRCLAIILLSILLAEPVWRSSVTKEENKAWVLVERGAFSETYSHFRNEIDSLMSAGNELHLFQPGFEKTDLEELSKDTAANDSSAKLPYWSLIKLMEQQIPNGSKAFIFTSDKMSRFKGSRPATTTSITWKTYTSSDSTSKWIDNAYLSISGDIRAMVSESNPRGTVTKAIQITPGAANADIKASIRDGKPELQLNSQTVIADTSALTIAINAEGFPGDAEYLTASIIAIQRYTSRKIKIVKPSPGQDILFWLSAKDLPANLNPGSMVFQYAKGKVVSTNTWVALQDGQTSIQTEQILVHKRIIYPEKANTSPIWKDGYGIPLLDLSRTNDISQYTFYSRLSPEWSDLVWSPEFVKLLMPLLLPDIRSGQQQLLDKRSVSRAQILPSSDLRLQTSDLRLQTSDLRPRTFNLQSYLWIFLMAVFLVERSLSIRNSSN